MNAAEAKALTATARAAQMEQAHREVRNLIPQAFTAISKAAAAGNSYCFFDWEENGLDTYDRRRAFMEALERLGYDGGPIDREIRNSNGFHAYW